MKMKNVFDKIGFIKPDIQFDPAFTGKNHAPMFRKKFTVEHLGEAKIYVCGLGYAYYYINGKLISPDLFTAPVSQYNKTLWYLTYDVTELLVKGENTAAVICGNGCYNEEFSTPWNYNEAEWRDLPKFILRLTVNGKDILVSDDSWKCSPHSAVVFNALRSGEHFDSTLYDPNWNSSDFDDSSWEYARKDDTAPKGVFRECLCEPIREDTVFDVKEIHKIGERKYVFDIGQNISGYIRLTVTGKRGQLLTIRYAERIKQDNTLELEGLTRFFPESEFQTDKFVCCGKRMTWSPKFAYHGFRYIEIDGVTDINDITVQGVFVHQAIRALTEFSCSNDILNRLFRAGRYSCYSNMFYLLSDCPTREKLGWTNDAHMSAEQMFTDFKLEGLARKWLVDIHDAMREDGSLPGIIPTSGWGYHWGNGPLSDGILFELPYRIYLHTGKADALTDSLSYMKLYLDYLRTREDANGWVTFGLGDWATAGNRADIPVAFVDAVLINKYCKIAALSAEISNNEELRLEYLSRAAHWEKKIFDTYISDDGRCTINKQAAVAILIYHGLYRELEPLQQQLKALVEEKDFHHDCGILGVRCLYEALNKCGLEEYAYRIIMAEGFPSYRLCMDLGSTTLWEWWTEYLSNGEYNSRNHHMYSDFMSWLIKTVLGLRHDKTDNSVPEFTLSPYYFEHLTYAKGSYLADNGKVSVHWKRSGDGILLTVTIEGDTSVSYKGQTLTAGTHEFTI
ncbi:MAG: family 78 glycoside hydrolase catalytic domain [Clostridia bacterium]|nr:family 78 glycoside hydrolase catalytic domain [Clostridia bacterium]